jgi:hypothetical protein
VFDATHLPPLLRTPDEPVELAYDVHCAASEDAVDAGCAARGTVYVRAVGEDSFTSFELEERATDGVRQLVVLVSGELARAPGLEYFAVLEAGELGERLVVPDGGAAAPHVSRLLDSPVEIDLGRHAFGRERRSGALVASAPWGDGPAQAGLEQGRHLSPIGAASFDVDSRGNVLLLDQVNRRVLRWRRGAKAPERIPVSVNGTLADLAAADDGSLFVLETTSPEGRNPSVRRFDDGGRELEAVEVAERSPSQLRIDARGPTVLGGASHRWLPVQVGGVPATPEEQVRRGRAGRSFRGGVEVVVIRIRNEVRVALVSGGVVTRAWRLVSETPLAEVQLAEPVGRQAVVVVRVYDERLGDEFAVLILGRNGLAGSFGLDPADWAESAPLGRFRLVGRSLYRLGSAPAGVFVDRHDLEVR